ncbi:hypothetical protein Tco_0610952 [Tanacetum coccineum]
MADVRKPEGTSNDGFQTVQRKDFRGPLGSKKGTVDNEKPMDEWLRYTDELELLPEDSVFGRAVEEVEHRNAYSENG